MGGEREWDNATWLQRSSTLWSGLLGSYATEEVCDTLITNTYVVQLLCKIYNVSKFHKCHTYVVKFTVAVREISILKVMICGKYINLNKITKI